MNMARLMNFLFEADTSSISDPELQSAMSKLGEIADLILTIIYIVLAAFLVIKGAILGMQIVKAADEPQVRQEKIGSLKWLVIGVAIAYGVAGIADLAIGLISKETNLGGGSTGSVAQ